MNIHSVLSSKVPDRPERADKRAAILRAATDVFANHGFFNAQVADVARAAGVAAGTVYLYFRSKDDLLVSIFERTMRDAITEGRDCIVSLSDPIERLRAIARVHLERLGRDRSLAVVFQVELRQSTKFMERFSTTALREYPRDHPPGDRRRAVLRRIPRGRQRHAGSEDLLRRTG